MKAIIDIKGFKRVIKALKPFVAQDNFRSVLQYIRVKVNGEAGEVRFEALDGHRIAIEYLKCNAVESFEAFIKPMQFWKTDSEMVELELFAKCATVSFGYYSIKFDQPKDEWPDVEKFLSSVEDKKPDFRVGINSEFLMDALRCAEEIHSVGRKVVIIETRGEKEAVVIRNKDEQRNIRLVLPVNIY
jgi:DNA polymerase III sliding clamp (beta) subunit (PCNA family)